jgi:hypothetical protein
LALPLSQLRRGGGHGPGRSQDSARRADRDHRTQQLTHGVRADCGGAKSLALHHNQLVSATRFDIYPLVARTARLNDGIAHLKQPGGHP